MPPSPGSTSSSAGLLPPLSAFSKPPPPHPGPPPSSSPPPPPPSSPPSSSLSSSPPPPTTRPGPAPTTTTFRLGARSLLCDEDEPPPSTSSCLPCSTPHASTSDHPPSDHRTGPPDQHPSPSGPQQLQRSSSPSTNSEHQQLLDQRALELELDPESRLHAVADAAVLCQKMEYAPRLGADPELAGVEQQQDDAVKMPALGQTRCYWAILDNNLNFVYLDPVLEYHMGEQASSMLGTSFHDYIHPAEASAARADLDAIIRSQTIFGSVTRVRFARLPIIRQRLGCLNPEVDATASRVVAADDNRFLPIDVVVNTIHPSLVLVFFHALIDKDPQSDNDESNKTGWTNWCHLPVFNPSHASSLHSRISHYASQHPPHHPPVPPGAAPQRVFQILRQASPETTQRGLNEVVFSWPPPEGWTGEGTYDRAHYATLLGEVSIHQNTGGPMSDARTSCTRRFRAKHTVKAGGTLRSIDSIFVPYGAIIFACFQTTFEAPLLDRQSTGATSTATAAHTLAAPSHNPSGDWFAFYQHQQPVDPSKPSTSDPRASISAASAGSTVTDGDDSAPPARPTVCASCGTDKSPEWRRGPSGQKNLCNACGLRYARAVAKQENGGQPVKRRRADSKSGPKATKASSTSKKKTSVSAGSTSSATGATASSPTANGTSALPASAASPTDTKPSNGRRGTTDSEMSQPSPYTSAPSLPLSPPGPTFSYDPPQSDPNQAHQDFRWPPPPPSALSAYAGSYLPPNLLPVSSSAASAAAAAAAYYNTSPAAAAHFHSAAPHDFVARHHPPPPVLPAPILAHAVGPNAGYYTHGMPLPPFMQQLQHQQPHHQQLFAQQSPPASHQARAQPQERQGGQS